MREPGSLGGNPLKDVVDEGVHDGHGLGRDAGVGVDLLQDLVDVDGVRLLPAPLGGAFPVLARRRDGLLGLAGLLGGAGRGGRSGFPGLGRHVDLESGLETARYVSGSRGKNRMMNFSRLIVIFICRRLTPVLTPLRKSKTSGTFQQNSSNLSDVELFLNF